ncbi:hypothetical protein PHYSODRAFT_529669 [Phytophthora sojae]|uniref:HAT C-terminal dimerisation domain-containing protein n=1 Tax=Phytophthora sojae (strain P6497) TaxID=1094619 RepID=G5ABU0_PHYSP|nr:hypothetical protein PHYSODRAFT_529669 [Phytophthora sojae]EGZ06815.1 hypothetical protein PHYSODRAFT_529669 [Phytophthora sojae]|eukprot:XP_009537579.1 hypothetical protein PHYSODRAFT_529669 [Phytophthora sojae]
MLRRLLELRPALQNFLEYIQTSVGKEEFSDVKIARPTGEMWFHIQCLDKLLVSFDGMTTLLSGETYATMPLILPSLRLLETRLQNKKVFAKVAKGELYSGPTLRRMHLVPRLFLLLLRKRFSKLPDDVKSCCLQHPHFAHGKFLQDDEKIAAALFLENEAMRLTGADGVDFDPNTSVDVIRKYFGGVATSVPSERCFSAAGNAVTNRRNKLTGDNVRDIIFLHSNQDPGADADESNGSS